MNLQDFISETLIGIVAGMDAAAKQIGDRASINPRGTQFAFRDGATAVYFDYSDSPAPHLTLVHFDVAVTAESRGTTGGGGKAGIEIGVISASLDASKEKSAASGSQSRLQFSIPILLPQTDPPPQPPQQRMDPNAAFRT